MNINIEVPSQRIADMIIGAVEGGSTYWARSLVLKSTKIADRESPWYADPRLYEDETLELELIEDEPSAPNHDGKYTIKFADFAKGLTIMAQKHAWHFGNMISENDDATTADVLLQCIALGELVYG
jgi:hypothetical protein